MPASADPMTPTAEQALEALRDIAEGSIPRGAADLLRRHIESTAAELEALRASTASVQADQRAENDRLRGEVEAMRKDAARYRGLRDNPDVDPGHLLFWQTKEDRALIDEKVDAALTQGGE